MPTTNPSLPLGPISRLEQIKMEATTSDKINIIGGGSFHESLFRSFSALSLLKQMIQRGDSTETMLMILHYLGY